MNFNAVTKNWSNLSILFLSRTSIIFQKRIVTSTAIIWHLFTRKCCPIMGVKNYTIAMIFFSQNLWEMKWPKLILLSDQTQKYLMIWLFLNKGQIKDNEAGARILRENKYNMTHELRISTYINQNFQLLTAQYKNKQLTRAAINLYQNYWLLYNIFNGSFSTGN